MRCTLGRALGWTESFAKQETAPTRARGRAAVQPRASASAGSLPFELLRTAPGYELRVYGAYAVASTSYNTRPEGLERLARYFDGANAAGARLPPTQPLITRYEPQPADGSLAKWMELRVETEGQAPQPAAGIDVELFVSGGEALAVCEVRGTVTPELAEGARRQLLAALARDGLRAEDGPFCLAAYGPLYSLSERRNELWVRVLT